MKNVTNIPKGKYLWDVMQEKGSQVEKAWVYVHQNAIQEIGELQKKQNYEGVQILRDEEYLIIYEGDAQKKTIRRITIEYDVKEQWHRIEEIQIEGIAFKKRTKDPERVIFIKQEK